MGAGAARRLPGPKTAGERADDGAAVARAPGSAPPSRDFDNDGFPDLAVVNGRVRRPSADPPPVPGLSPYWARTPSGTSCSPTTATGKFRDVSRQNPAFCGRAPRRPRPGVGDLDNDGGLDLVVTSVAGPVRLFRNIAPGRGHWLTVPRD